MRRDAPCADQTACCSGYDRRSPAICRALGQPFLTHSLAVRYGARLRNSHFDV